MEEGKEGIPQHIFALPEMYPAHLLPPEISLRPHLEARRICIDINKQYSIKHHLSNKRSIINPDY
jgi:hypothetical protein